MDIVVRLAQHGLIHGDYNEFNIMICRDETPILIDFPQMISTSHANAEWYFNRDVECIRVFFKKRFGYESVLFPKFTVHGKKEFDLDVQVAASGFTKKHQQEFDELLKDTEQDEEFEENDDEDEGEGEGEEVEEKNAENGEATEKAETTSTTTTTVSVSFLRPFLQISCSSLHLLFRSQKEQSRHGTSQKPKHQRSSNPLLGRTREPRKRTTKRKRRRRKRRKRRKRKRTRPVRTGSWRTRTGPSARSGTQASHLPRRCKRRRRSQRRRTYS